MRIAASDALKLVDEAALMLHDEDFFPRSGGRLASARCASIL